jgi:hypothetical protein
MAAKYIHLLEYEDKHSPEKAFWSLGGSEAPRLEYDCFYCCGVRERKCVCVCVLGLHILREYSEMDFPWEYMGINGTIWELIEIYANEY